MCAEFNIWIFLFVFSIPLSSFSQSIKRDTIYYKKRDSISLMMEVHYPPDLDKTKNILQS